MTDQQILEGLRIKDPSVFKYLFKEYGDKVVGYVMKNSGSREDGEDLTIEVVVKIWQNVSLGHYQDNNKFRSYFFTVAYNTWLNILRGRKIRTTESDEVLKIIPDDDSEDFIRNLIKNKRLDALEKALSQLGAMCQNILKQFHLNEKSSKELAEELSINDNAMRVRLHDCRLKLKNLALKILGNSDDK